MRSAIRTLLRRYFPWMLRNREGAEGVLRLGHRRYVGGMWEEIGALQMEFLLSRGLTPQDRLLDIACGSLRLGVRAIPFLDPGCYLGIEKEQGLVEAGLREELPVGLEETKRPNILISSRFEFEKLGETADFAIAQSLFTHLPPDLIGLCFENLHACLRDTGVFFATYLETKRQTWNPAKPDDLRAFVYTREEMCRFGESRGYSAEYVGDWNHPRGQVMMEYRKR